MFWNLHVKTTCHVYNEHILLVRSVVFMSKFHCNSYGGNPRTGGLWETISSKLSYRNI